jgi:hypothetical protein
MNFRETPSKIGRVGMSAELLLRPLGFTGDAATKNMIKTGRTKDEIETRTGFVKICKRFKSLRKQEENSRTTVEAIFVVF